MTDTKQAELELTVIRKIMEDSRRAVYDTSIQGMFWTMLMAPAILINYFMLIFETGLKYSGFLWLGTVIIGITGSILIAYKEKRIKRVKTFAGKILTTIGIAVGGANLMFAFASVIANAFNPVYIIPVDSVVLGMAFYVVGIIQQLKSLKFLAFIWWSGALFFYAVPSFHCLLFFAVMLIVSVWIPKIEEKRVSQKSLTGHN